MAIEAHNVVKIGFEMIEIINRVRSAATNEQLRNLNMRIGIHTGDIIAGIIGTKIVRYDIFGSNVLIANKMESNGVAGKVVVSDSTKGFLQQFPDLELDKAFEFKFNESVKCEAVDQVVDAYVVEPIKDDDSYMDGSRLGADDEVLSSSLDDSDESGSDE